MKSSKILSNMSERKPDTQTHILIFPYFGYQNKKQNTNTP